MVPSADRLLHYGVGLGAVAVALGLNLVLWPLIQPAVSPLFFAAVMAAAWYGGLGPGLAATIVATAASAFFFMPPLYSLAIGYDDVLRLVVFAMVAVFISWLNAKRDQAERARAELLAREQDARREAQAANRAKDEFLAMVSHELRTPLTAILGWVRVLRAGTLDPERAARALEVIERNTEAQNELIEDLLDVARIITGKLAIERRPLDLVQVVEQAVRTVLPVADAKGVRLTVSTEAAAASVDGDAGRLRQVVLNLLTNAIKFTPRGGTIDLRLSRIADEAVVTVSDTGKGINPEFLPYVFDRFRQAEGAAALGGLGLGLAIVRHIVDQHAGSIRADSAGQGKGAVFTVRLPIAARMSETPGPTAVAATLAAVDDFTALRGVRVLVVDDAADARELLVTVLEQYGAEAVAVGSAADALEAVRRQPPDVLVSDIGMPGESGYALVRRLRALPRHAGGNVPALALSAYARDDDSQQALRAGFQLHLGKPVEPARLAAAVAALAARTADPAAT
jgi:signal transduction histidine kinase/ActR/RegA family two-component response regulator